MTNAVQVVAYDQNDLTNRINMYVMGGFAVASREPDCVTLVKRKEFKIVWAVVGFFLCLLPLLIYLVVYALESDQVVMIRVANPGSMPAVPAAPALRLSPDRRYWWDGTTWRDATLAIPPGAQRSPDGTMWWDGVEWRGARPAIEG
jgi:hypothetical protein